ncbi:MAG: hypothetical protein O6763_05415, partial [Gammaproteobacteria bacterium]|nr:hypothetical protein [Gammaproteobacteria bacterium]
AINPVTAANGQADGTFAASGCSGDDVVTATASVSGSVLTATGTITVAAASVGSIQFISATPELIGLQGTGGLGISETSRVIFRVVDSTGGPVAGSDVDFALSTTVGGISLTPVTATSGANGDVQTVVTSGTVATSVRVSANVVGAVPAIGTQSSLLNVSTGIPHQAAFSLSVETCNIEAFIIDGVVDPVTVILSDRFQNPVPDGTAVAFNAEGGSIVSQCTTIGGTCTVDWVSANPRPLGPAGPPGPVVQTGRVTVLATAIGEESFGDLNSNGKFDTGEPFDDLEEPFRDDNESFIYEEGMDGFFLDFFTNGAHDPADGDYSGLECNAGAVCAASSTLGIGGEVVIVMATSALLLPPSVPPPLVGTGSVTFLVTDLNGNAPPAGTVIKVDTITNGTVVGPNSWTVPDICAPGPYAATFSIEGDPAVPPTGTLFVEATVPSGLTTRTSYAVND